jgi:hypothetical protein
LRLNSSTLKNRNITKDGSFSGLIAHSLFLAGNYDFAYQKSSRFLQGIHAILFEEIEKAFIEVDFIEQEATEWLKNNKMSSVIEVFDFLCKSFDVLNKSFADNTTNIHKQPRNHPQLCLCPKPISYSRCFSHFLLCFTCSRPKKQFSISP